MKRLVVVVIASIVMALSMSPLPTLASFDDGRADLSATVRWCGVEGAPSMQDPGAVGEATTDDVLWRRHERPSERIYIPLATMTFRSGATAAIKNGVQSFPIIRDPRGTGGNISDSGEATDAVRQCRRAWLMGDPLYFDANANGAVNGGGDSLLSVDVPVVGFAELGHDGAPLNAAPAEVKFVDLDGDNQFDIGERIYRDENADGVVDGGDTLLSAGTLGTVVGNIDPADSSAELLSVPTQVRYLDLIREPPNTFNIGYPNVVGLTAVNANDFDIPGFGFPVHGIAALGICGDAALMDDPSYYLPPGPDFQTFETQLVGHEFGHAFCLNHGDGNDDDGNGLLDDGDDPPAPFAGAGPGTLCDSNNLMQYCWRDTGVAANPNMVWIGSGTPVPGVLTGAQTTAVRNHALTLSDTTVDPVPLPLRSARSDVIAEVPSDFAFVDIAEILVTVDRTRASTEFALTTRRPLPRPLMRRSKTTFYFAVDRDNNSATGGSPSTVGAPSKFAGAELVTIVRLVPTKAQPVNVLAFKFNPASAAFEPLVHRSIRGGWVTVRPVIDYAGLRQPQFVAERVSVIMANKVRGPLAPAFRVEYISSHLGGDVVDRATTQGMNFAPPVFPSCETDPPAVRVGAATTVRASGLLPDRKVHVLLGPREVAATTSDSEGNAAASFEVPRGARRGKHLITVGALAVTGDCFLIVKK